MGSLKQQIAMEVVESPEYWSKSAFLDYLKGNGVAKYKRYNGLPLRYAGGKSLAVGFVLEHIPADTRRLMSPFIGGGAVEIACARELGIDVVGYDIFDILTTYWDIQINYPEKLASILETYSPDSDTYNNIKTTLKAHWKGEVKIADKKQLAAYYWFNHNLSYGPGFLGWMSKIYECPKRYERLLAKVRDFDCPLLSVKRGSFERTIPAHSGEFLYCDPPYYLNDGKMFRGIYPQRNFPVHHNGFDHLLLSQLLKEHDGGWVLSYNDCDTIRELYADYDIYDVSWQYTMGQGETRIGANRKNRGDSHVKKSHEILIVNHG